MNEELYWLYQRFHHLDQQTEMQVSQEVQHWRQLATQWREIALQQRSILSNLLNSGTPQQSAGQGSVSGEEVESASQRSADAWLREKRAEKADEGDEDEEA